MCGASIKVLYVLCCLGMLVRLVEEVCFEVEVHRFLIALYTKIHIWQTARKLPSNVLKLQGYIGNVCLDGHTVSFVHCNVLGRNIL